MLDGLGGCSTTGRTAAEETNSYRNIRISHPALAALSIFKQTNKAIIHKIFGLEADHRHLGLVQSLPSIHRYQIPGATLKAEQ